ncbi:MAG: geranylgeranylglyceryl/heptaprenylglyceryl phosphate synthase [Bacteroidota bacterium]
MSKFIQHIQQLKADKKKALAVLIDPDSPIRQIAAIAQQCQVHKVDYIFAGGSLVTTGVMAEAIQTIQSHCSIPIYIFPGNELMIDEQADGILFLSLLSGRNPEYLIGKHVVAAPQLAASSLDVVATAYLLIDGGRETSVSYISNTKPIPADKADIAVATALAGKLMGMRCIYMDAGSGADKAISEKMADRVSSQVNLPLIIGGGIRQAETALALYQAGADVLVIGNGVEENDSLIERISKVRNQMAITVNI